MTPGDDVRASLVAAAVQEMVVQGIAGASLAAIAARAGVELAVVHHHFESKEALLGGVLDQLADDVAAAFDRGGLPALTGPASSRYARVLARAILDGYDVRTLQTTYPVVERVLPVAVELAHLPETEVKVLLARQVALQFGWLLYEPFIAASVGLTDEELTFARDGSAPFWGMFTPDVDRD